MSFTERCLLRLLRKLPDRTWGHRLAILLRRPLKYGKRSEFEVTVWGLSLLLQPRGNVTETRLLFTPRFFDPHERKYIACLRKTGPDDFLFLDAGANIGAYSYWVYSLWQKRARILAFEANPELARRFLANLERNQTDTVEVHNIALSPEEGFLEFQLDPENLGESHLAGEASGSRHVGSAGNRIRVAARRLSPYVKELDRPADLLKIDIEGAEVPVLEELFQGVPPDRLPFRILSEYKENPEHSHLEDMLIRNGYRLRRAFRTNRLYERSGNGA